MEKQEEIIGTVEASQPEEAFGLHNSNGFFNPVHTPNRKRMMNILEKEAKQRTEIIPKFSKKSDDEVIKLLEEWRALQDKKTVSNIEAIERIRESEKELWKRKADEEKRKKEMEANKAWL